MLGMAFGGPLLTMIPGASHTCVVSLVGVSMHILSSDSRN